MEVLENIHLLKELQGTHYKPTRLGYESGHRSGSGLGSGYGSGYGLAYGFSNLCHPLLTFLTS